jgi:hypothetical protein
MNHRGLTALLVSGALTIAGCGDKPDDGSTERQPATAAGVDPAAAWEEYYDLTHPAPRVDPVTPWEEYYEQTHPAPEIDAAAAWEVYYDLTHPDDGLGG